MFIKLIRYLLHQQAFTDLCTEVKYVYMTNSISLTLFTLPGVHSVHASVRVSRDPADPGALHPGADDSDPGGAARAHGAAGSGPVRQLRHPARPGARPARRQDHHRRHHPGQGPAAQSAQVRQVRLVGSLASRVNMQSRWLF